MPAQNINVEELKALIAKNEVCLIDVREPHEYAAENIAAATLIPLAEVSLKKLPKFDGKKLVIHCRSGKRSLTVCEKLLEENPELEVYNLEGGIIAWSLLGGEVVKS